jgi:hypothetical protein
MIHSRTTLLFATLALALSLGACKKEEAPPPVATPAPAPAPAPAPKPAPASAATVSVVSLELGNAASADMKLSTPSDGVFKPTDTIIASVGTQTSDQAATVQGKLAAKWTYQDGQTVNEESKDVAFSGGGTTNFQISKPDGWPKGKYKVEISLDGNVVQSKDFEIK